MRIEGAKIYVKINPTVVNIVTLIDPKLIPRRRRSGVWNAVLD